MPLSSSYDAKVKQGLIFSVNTSIFEIAGKPVRGWSKDPGPPQGRVRHPLFFLLLHKSVGKPEADKYPYREKQKYIQSLGSLAHLINEAVHVVCIDLFSCNSPVSYLHSGIKVHIDLRGVVPGPVFLHSAFHHLVPVVALAVVDKQRMLDSAKQLIRAVSGK